MFRIIRLTILIIIFFSTLINGQSQGISWKERIYFEGIPHYGYVIPHHDFIAYFIDEHIKGYEFTIGLHTPGNQKWQRTFNYPNVGIGFYHSGLGNQEVFGKINALYYYVERLYRNQDRRFNFGNKFSIGMAYVTKRHDIIEDNYNMAIGSNFNVYLHYSIEATYRLTEHVTAKIGAGLTHTSNGNYREPNKGLNLITGTASLQYNLYAYHPDKNKIWVDNTTDQPVNQFIINGGFGRKQNSMLNNTIYTPIFLSMEYEHRVNESVWLGPAICVYRDNSINKDLELVGDSAVDENTKIRISTHLSAEINMGKMSFVFQPGVYIKNSYTKIRIISNRLGCRYALTDHILGSVMIKAHWPAIADFVEWGICYRWSGYSKKISK